MMVLTAENQEREMTHEYSRKKAEILPFPGQKKRDELSDRVDGVPEYYCIKIDLSMLGEDALGVYCSAIDDFRNSISYQKLDNLSSKVAMETDYAMFNVERYIRRRDNIRPYEVLLWTKPSTFVEHRFVDIDKMNQETHIKSESDYRN